jgi:UDP-N-acetylmuramate: L-alanyl-gamma-D-glutamyl-meso-diaminopimelate ligase
MSSFRHVHILGVCGTLMGSFASYLKRAGVRVTGSDQNVYPPMSDVLQFAGVELFSPYSAENLQKITQNGMGPDLIVIGNVISKGNVEMNEIEQSGIPYVSLPEFMEKHMLPQTRNLVVAGTHGKTTTSSILAHVLSSAGEDPSYFIGGVSQSLPHSFHVSGKKNYFVLEGDEYDTAFWDKVPKFNHYLPNDVILTSVEFDHADIYADLAAVKQAFAGLISRIRSSGRLIACFESANVRELAASAKVPVISYSRNDADRAALRGTQCFKCSSCLYRVFRVGNFSRPDQRCTFFFSRSKATSGRTRRSAWCVSHRRFCTPSDSSSRNAECIEIKIS